MASLPDAAPLRAEIARFRSSHPHGLYPEPLRLKILAFARPHLLDGLSLWALTRSLGLTFTTLQKWLAADETPSHASPFLPVLVRPALASSPPLSLVLPGGARVEGLSLDDLVTLCHKVTT